MPTTCAERANSPHITLEDGSWRSDTISNSQRTQDLYKRHHNFLQSRAEGSCSYSVSNTTKIFIKQFFGRDRIYTGRFSYLPVRDKRGQSIMTVPQHPFTATRRYSTDTRVRVIPAWKCSVSFQHFCYKNADQQITAGQLCGLQDYQTQHNICI
jgi:hypothetical protein